MKVAVGSENPVKIAAVSNVVKKVWPAVTVSAIGVGSGVSDMPASDDEAIRGALNRARAARERDNADIGFGLEGSFAVTNHGMFLTGWTVAVHRDGRVGVGGGGRILLPEKIAAELRKGRELGPVVDELTGDHNSKQKEGTVGLLTAGLLTRTRAFEIEVTNALTRFLKEDLYKE